MIPFPGTLFSLRCHSWVSGTTCDDQLRLAHLQKRSVRMSGGSQRQEVEFGVPTFWRTGRK